MRNAERLADAAGIVDILAGAAGAGAVDGGAMIVELQRDAENVVALPLQDAGHHGAVDAARHGNDDARIFRLRSKSRLFTASNPAFRSIGGLFAFSRDHTLFPANGQRRSEAVPGQTGLTASRYIESRGELNKGKGSAAAQINFIRMARAIACMRLTESSLRVAVLK
jgi:hypothetical protein